MEREINLCTCRNCQKIKIRQQDGKYNGKDKRWIDQNGRKWNGRKCPECQAETMRSRMKVKRSKDKDNA